MRATHRVVLGAALASGLALAACGMGVPSGYPDFSKTPAFHIEGVRTPVGGGVSQRVAIYRDGRKLRVETQIAGQGRTIVVFDNGTNEAYALTSMPPPTQTPTQTTTATTTTTPAETLPLAPPPNVIGRAVRVDDAQAPQPLETSWAALTAASAANITSCRVAGERGREWRATSTSLEISKRTACITPDGIVLRLREGNQTIFEATRLQRGPQLASLFGVPPGFERVNPNAVAESATSTATSVVNTGPAG